jgi:hypothetical protein
VALTRHEWIWKVIASTLGLDDLSFVEREYILQVESDRLIAQLAHPGCWACAHSMFGQHRHIERPRPRSFPF